MTPSSALREEEAPPRPIVVETPPEAQTRQRNVDQLLDSIQGRLDELTQDARELADQMEGSALQQEVLQALTLEPKDRRVRSHKDYERSWECLRSIQGIEKLLNDKMGSVISTADDLHGLLLGSRKAVELPAKECKDGLVAQIKKWFLDALANWRTRQEEFPNEAAVLKLRKMPGGSITLRFGAEIEDKSKLIAFVATHPQHNGYLQPNMSALNSVAKGQETTMSIPGVIVIPKVTVRVNAWK